MTAKKPAAPSKASPVTQAKPAVAPALPPRSRRAAAAAPKGKPAAEGRGAGEDGRATAARATAKAPAAPPAAAKGKRGAKAAAEPAKKLPDMPADEDFADLEADAEATSAVDARNQGQGQAAAHEGRRAPRSAR